MKFKTLIIFASFLSITAFTQVKEDKNQETQEAQETAESSIKLYSYAPSTVSSEAKAIIETFTDALSKPAMPTPDAIEQWKMIQQGMENATKDQNQALIDELDINVSAIDLGGTLVLDIKPKGWKDNGKVLVYTHGGAYVLFSAMSTIGISGIVAQATGIRVISIDYTLAPHANWIQISDGYIELTEDGKKALS